MMIPNPLRPIFAAALFLVSSSSLACSLNSGALVAPLAPGQKADLSLGMPPGFAADQEVWVVYDLVALSRDGKDSGEVAMEQAFEGVMTPATALYAIFHADDMESSVSAGTIAQRLEEIAGHREPAELQRLMGAELYAAYESVNAGNGRILTGRLVKRLPAPGRADTPLMISVERAEGIQPLALSVTVGQGALSPEFQPKAEGSWAYKVGYFAGIAFFGWLVLRFFRRRR
jgi:hypothetical protein